MKGNATVMVAFLTACAIITYRDIKNPDAQWPLPAPPPYRYVGAGVAFGLLALTGQFFNEKLAAVLAVGLVIGLGFQTAQSGLPGDFGKSNGGGTYTPLPGNGMILGGGHPLTPGNEATRPL